MISVIIPTLNEEKLLRQMLGQFTPEIRKSFDIEVIVSDGGSLDNTVSIARAHGHVVLENPADRRQNISLGRNVGAAHAHGDVLVFLNADTLLQDADLFFQRALSVLRSDNVCAATCSVEVYPEERRLADRWFHGFYNWLFEMMNRAGIAMGRGECHIVKRSAFEFVGGYSGRIAAGEDYDLFRRVRAVGRVKFLRDVIVYESPRRYRKYGYLYVTVSWFVNFLSVLFLRRSLFSQWKPVR